MNTHQNTRRAATIAAAAVVGILAAACGSSSSAPSTSPVTVFNVAADPGQNLPVANPSHHVALTAAELQTTLDSLLSKHAALVATLMHQVGAGDDSPTAAITDLAANTQDLTNAIALVYGNDGARAFAQLWEQHTQFFIDYAHADRVHDNGAKRLAQRRLLDYQNDFASFVNAATANGASLTAVTGLLHSHVHDLTSFIDADVAGHRAEAQQILQKTIADMHVIAKAISGAIAAQHLDTVTP